MEKTIKVTIRDKIAVAQKGVEYICGNSDFVVEFDFDEEWEEYANKTARFAYKDTHQDVIFSGNKCPIPVISDVFSFNVGVFAGNLKTTTPASVPAKKSILCGGGVPAAPSDDVYNQIMKKLNAIDGETKKTAVATSSDGVAYTATIEGITKLDQDLEINIIPNMTSESVSATLNVNGLGAKPIRVSSASSRGSYYPATQDYLAENRMVKLFYDGYANNGNGVWKAISFTRPTADNISGQVSPEHGGTGLDWVYSGYYLVGNGTDAMDQYSPTRVLEHLGAVGHRGYNHGNGTPASYDANKFVTSGIWTVNIMGSYDPVVKCHLPARDGIFIVFAAEKYIWQEFVDFTKAGVFAKYSRGSVDGGKTWSDWEQK